MINWSYVLERNAEKFPDKEAVIFQDTRLTYKEINERVNGLAKGLLDSGIRKGDIVAILLYNCAEFLEITFAVNKIGAIWLPLNWRLVGPELSYILNNAQAKMLISQQEFSEVIEFIKKDLPSVKEYIGVGKDVPEDWKSYDEIVSTNLGSVVPHESVELDDLSRLMYTSGTTAHPKGVMITYGNLYWKNISHILDLDLTHKDKILVVGPLYHVGGLDLPATGVLYVGGSIVILKAFDPIEFLKAIDKERITGTWLAPAMINIILQEPSIKQYDVSSLRYIIAGGEKMPEPLIRKVMESFPNTWFADAYGLTETVSGDTFLKKDKGLEKLGSVGKAVPHLEIKIFDDNDKEVPAKELGEIVLKGPKVFKGYWNNPEATAETIKNGWFHTGDIGYVDEEGYLYIVDRKKDVIISGGENIASLEVERVIYENPKVLEVGVVGIPHPKWREVPKAYIVLKEGESMTPQELFDFCIKKLAKFKVPKEVEFIDSLPRNPSGKILKRELREMARKKMQEG